MGEGDTLLNAVLGAVVTIVLSFTGFSPLIGGGVAGYLQRGTRAEGAKVGAISGGIAAVPFLFVLFLFFGLFLATPVMMGGLPGVPELLVIVFILLPVLFVWNAGLGAAGGYLGTYVREETDSAGGGT